MSSGFVSGGTVENPTERDDEWRKAQAELEAARLAKADLAAQHNGKSLFEILQENKDKKQAEFEEKARYKLHVSLNDEEADYLDSIEEKKRKEEEHVRNDTREQLEAFKRQQEEAEKKALEDLSTEAPREHGAQWVAPGRKRKKTLDTSLLKGVKLKKPSSAAGERHGFKPSKGSLSENATQAGADKVHPTITPAHNTATTSTHPAAVPPKAVHAASPPKSTNPLSLGLGYASSDDES